MLREYILICIYWRWVDQSLVGKNIFKSFCSVRREGVGVDVEVGRCVVCSEDSSWCLKCDTIIAIQSMLPYNCIAGTDVVIGRFLLWESGVSIPENAF